MAITRRLFLRVGTLSGLTAAIPLTAYQAFGQKVGAPEVVPEDSGNSTFINTEILGYITASVFDEYIGTSFQVRKDAVNTERLVLEQVKVRENSERLDTFTLLFSSPSGEPMTQASYLFEHEQMGLFPLFLVPVMTLKGMRYEAVFNRLRGPAKKGAK